MGVALKGKSDIAAIFLKYSKSRNGETLNLDAHWQASDEVGWIWI